LNKKEKTDNTINDIFILGGHYSEKENLNIDSNHLYGF